MLGYVLLTLRARTGSFVGAFLALFCAAAVIVACGSLLETGLRGTLDTERYAAAPVVVGADQNVRQVTVSDGKEKHKAKPIAERAWLPAETAAELADLSGVDSVVGEVTFPAYAVDADGQVVQGVDGADSLGHAWASAPLTPFTLVEGDEPEGDDDIVIDRELAERLGLGPGDGLTVQATEAPAAYRVVGVARAEAGDLRQQTSLFFSEAEAERLSGRGGDLTAIGMFPAEGVSTDDLADQASDALADTDVQVRTGGDRGRMEFLDGDNARIGLISIGAAMGGTALAVAMLVVAGTFTLSIQQRYRELALLRAVAATPRQVRRLIGREALMVGVLAGVAGALAGLPLASWLHGEFVRLGAVPDNLDLVRSPFPLFAAVFAVLLGGWVAARLAGRRAARIRPTEALAESAVELGRIAWPRLAIGTVVAAGGIVLLLVLSTLNTEPASTPVTFGAVIVLAVAVALLGPLLMRVAVVVLRVPLRASTVGGYLALTNVRAAGRRSATAVTTLALLVGMASTTFFVQTTIGAASESQARDGNQAEWMLGSDGPGVPGALAEDVEQLEGVTAVTEVVQTEVRIRLGQYTAQGVGVDGLTTNWDPDVVEGTLDSFDDSSVAVSEVAADRAGLSLGDVAEVTLGDGTEVELDVVAVYARGLGFGDLTMSHALVASHVDNPLAASVLVGTEASGVVDRGALDQAISTYPGVTLLDRDEVADLRSQAEAGNAEVNLLAMGLVIVFTAIAVVNTLAMTIGERSRELALLQLVGATRRQVRAMLRFEAAVIVVTGVVLGSGVALAALVAVSMGMTNSTVPSVDPVAYVVIVAFGALLVLLATVVAGRVAMAERPEEVIGSRL